MACQESWYYELRRSLTWDTGTRTTVSEPSPCGHMYTPWYSSQELSTPGSDTTVRVGLPRYKISSLLLGVLHICIGEARVSTWVRGVKERTYFGFLGSLTSLTASINTFEGLRLEGDVQVDRGPSGGLDLVLSDGIP